MKFLSPFFWRGKNICFTLSSLFDCSFISYVKQLCPSVHLLVSLPDVWHFIYFNRLPLNGWPECRKALTFWDVATVSNFHLFIYGFTHSIDFLWLTKDCLNFWTVGKMWRVRITSLFQKCWKSKIYVYANM